jgi:hypothetical protein
MVLALAFSAQAQTGRNEMRASIPFAFIAGETPLPAGDYTITQINPASDRAVLQLRSRDGKSTVMLQMNSVIGKAQNAKLVFHRYADRLFLAQAWTGDENSGLEAAKSKAERRLASQLARSERKIESVAITR